VANCDSAIHRSQWAKSAKVYRFNLPNGRRTMKILLAVAIVVAGASVSFGDPLPRSTPEAQGVDPAGVLAFVDSADKNLHSINSFMLVRHGHVVAEAWWSPYRPEARHMLYSLSKSFNATAVGLAIAEKKLSLDDKILDFFPEYAPPHPSKNLKAMRVRDLLRMSCGQAEEGTHNDKVPWAKTFFEVPVPFKPGTHFLYNTFGAYMLSATVQKATGQTVLDFLKPRLFEPLGIDDPEWTTSPQGVSFGGSGLYVRTEDIARFGQLYLQKGKWNGKQLLPESWVEEATKIQTSNGGDPASDWEQGYGYQFWRCRHGAYRGDGMYGQFCIVMPEQDAVIAITSCLKDMQQELNLVWDKLLPAMKDGPVRPKEAVRRKLADRLQNLMVEPVKGAAAPGDALGKTFEFPKNRYGLDWIRLERETGDSGAAGATTLVSSVAGREQRIVCTPGKWHDNDFTWAGFRRQQAAATGGWAAADTFRAKLSFYETTFYVNVKLKFTGGDVRLTEARNLTDDEPPEVILGKLKK
jgi:CubicO group peptidase (beta-lactamase class C family)